MSDTYAGEAPASERADDAANSVALSGDEPITELQPPSKLAQQEQFDVLKNWFKSDAEHSRDWRVGARDNFAFRAGEQWTEADRALLDSQQRPHIVFNRVLTILKAVAGMEINGRHEIHFVPRGTEDTAVNEVLSAASKWMGESCDGEDEESQAFDNCCTTGMGWVEERISFESDPAGLYVEESIDPREMYWDRTAKKKNLSDAKRMFRARRMALREAMAIFPGKTRQQLDAVWADDLLGDFPLKSIEEKRVRNEDNMAQLPYDDNCEVSIVAAQWIEQEIYWIVADERTNTMAELTDPEYRVFEQRMKQLGMQVHAARMSRKVYKSAYLGSELLQKVGDAPMKGQFSWKCITAEYDASTGTWFGLVKVMRDPQMWANKWLSQILHILNTTAKGGILAERSAFDDEREAEESYAHPEAITWVADGSLSGAEKPKIMPKPGSGMTEGYVALMTFAISSIKDVTGINLELLGQQDQNQPGIIEAMRKQAGMTVLATLFDSLRRFRKQIGRGRLFFIQNFLSDGRLIRVAGPESVNAVALARERTTGDYDVVVDDTPTSPNQKEANWAIIQPLLVVFKEQLMAQPRVFAMLLEYSPLPSRIVESIKAFIEQGENDPEAKQDEQTAKQLMIEGQQAIIEKDRSAAVLNQARAEQAKGKALTDIAAAKKMLGEGDTAGLAAQLDAMEQLARAEKANADAQYARARTTGLISDSRTNLIEATAEHARAANEGVDAGTRRIHAYNETKRIDNDAGNERIGQLIENLAAQAGVERDLAGAEKDLAIARREDRTPARPPAGKK